jgi:uncharacterized protein YxeA
MTAKEKAEELVNKYDETLTYLELKQKAKQCALIAVEEVLNSTYTLVKRNDLFVEYWQEVKQEVEKL